jgi:hypothetical protein
MAANNGFAKNIDLLAHHDLKGNMPFQMAMQEVGGRYYLYTASYRAPGCSILEVTDPANPRYIQFLKMDRPEQAVPKIQVADGLMITAMAVIHAPEGASGICIWDVKEDPENPKFLSYWNGDSEILGKGQFMSGVHRFFYNGGRYVHLSCTTKGFSGMIYRIIDIIDRKNPVEVGRWWMPEQWLPGVVPSAQDAILQKRVGIHGPPYVKGNLAYLSYGGAGLVILDISDITLPKLVGHLPHHPPFAGGSSGAWCHTVVPLSQRPYAIMTSEGERFPLFTKDIIKGIPQPMALFGMVDVSDPANPTLISTFPYPEVPPGFPYKNFNDCGIGCNGPFGPHNLHEPHDHPALEDRNDRIYCCYFHAGLRIYDISDPFVPKEIAYFIPPNPTKWLFGKPYDRSNPHFELFVQPPGPMIATAEDVIVDKRGNIFIDAFHDGIYVLQCTV